MSEEAGKLREYREKREFSITPEPGAVLPEQRTGPLLFSIQLHDATRLHWDLRLELNGVLKSWAIPKGPSYDPAEKRLAIQTEDHPFDYGSFEGAIPKGQYGAGEVIVWDCGTYWCDEHRPLPSEDREFAEAEIEKELGKGKLSVFFRGTKLKGSWALIKTKSEDQWLFFKHSDEFAREGYDPLSASESVLTGLTLDDMKRGLPVATKFSTKDLGPHGPEEKLPSKLQPMLATLSTAVFDHDAWIYEPKLDGIRALVYVQGDHVRIMTRKGLDFTKQFPDLASRLKRLKSNGVLLDCEIVAFGKDGKATFHAMQQRLNLAGEVAIAQADVEYPTAVYAFDILHADGYDLRSLPLIERKRLLSQYLLPDPRIQATTWVRREGGALLNLSLQAGFEGVVAKRADSRYEAGKRSKTWMKVKDTKSGEFVIGGYSKGDGARADTFGAILVGVAEGDGFRYVSHVGSGFDEQTLTKLLAEMKRLETSTCPFTERPPMNAETHWVRPELVAEIKYAEVTPLGNLRAPVFLALRPDIDPKQATFAVPAEPEEVAGATTVSALDGIVQAVVEQLESKKSNIVIQIGSHELPVTNLDKVLWPAFGEHEPARKRDLLKYLALVSPHMLRHLADRPMTMIRFPEGIHGEKFFQKHWDQRKPPFVETVRLYSESVDKDQDYVVAANLATMLWLGQLGTLEYHVPSARCVSGPDGEQLGRQFVGSIEAMESSLLNYPDYIEFDIDPYRYSGDEAPGDEPELHAEGFELGKRAAFWLRELVESLGLTAFVKTTGKTGLHVFAPIVRNLDFDSVRSICETFSRAIEREHPNEITTEWSIPKRTGKAFLDYNMNVRMKTLGCAYSPRALPTQAVSMPLTWEELKDAYPTQFTLRSAPGFLKSRPDVWATILEAKWDLNKLMG